MAAKSKGTGRASWEVDFVHLDLDSKQMADAKTWDVSCEQTFDCLSRCSLDGAKLSIVHDRRNDCSIASITTPKTDGAERQVCVSARGPDMVSALRILAYKIVKVLDGDLGNLKVTSEARAQWG
jgi:hypothetical protein